MCMPVAEWNRRYSTLMTSEQSDAPAPLPEEPENTADATVDDAVSPRRAGAAYALGRMLLAPLARMIYRPRVEGRENVPMDGRVILASNHLSFIDSLAIPIAAPRPVHFLAKSTYFEKPLSNWFFRTIGAIPVKRGAGQAALDALDQQRRLLEDDLAVALYPEGTRSTDGRLYKGRTGVAFLALQTGAPVVPVGLIGTDRVMPVGAKMPSLRERVTIRFGEPIDVSRHGAAGSGKARRLATDEIMAAIHALSEQELAGIYNEVPAQGAIEKIKRALPHERR